MVICVANAALAGAKRQNIFNPPMLKSENYSNDVVCIDAEKQRRYTQPLVSSVHRGPSCDLITF